MKLNLLGAIAVGVALLLPAPARAQAALVTPAAFSDVGQNGNFTMGFSFTVDQDMFLRALGAYDYQSDGFVLPKTVGLWDNAGNLLSQAAVTSAGTLQDSFRYTNVAPVVLTTGQTYVVGAYRYSGAGDVYATPFGALNPAPGVNVIQARLSDSGAFAFPDQLVGTAAYFGANALVSPTPEPAAWGMMILGFGIAGGALRRRRAARPAFG